MRLGPAIAVFWVVSGCAHPPLADPLPPLQPAPSLVVDLHLHVSMSQAAKPFFKGEAGGDTLDLARTGSARYLNQIDEQGLHAAGLRLVLGALWPPFDIRPGRSSLDEALNQLSQLRKFGLRRPGFSIATNAASARAILRDGNVAILPQLEGGEGIQEVDDVDRLWVAGVRSVTLVHFASSAIGGAAKDQLKRNLLGLTTGLHEPQGLTPLGRAVVERMMELGIVIDISHASDASSSDVLDLAERRGVPVINSHSPARALLDMERSIPDDLALRIVRGGGLVGVTVFDKMTEHVPESAQWPGFVPNTCDEVVAHWLYLAKVVGPEHLALGSDFNGFITRHGPGGSCPHGLRNVGDLPELFSALEAHGIPRAALDGMGENFLKLLETVEAKASPSARAAAHRVRTIDAKLFDAP